MRRLAFLKTRDGKKSERELARQMGLPQATLNKYMVGKNEPGLDRLIQIARGAGVSVDWLVGLTDAESEAHDTHEYVSIPLLSEPVSAGDGSLVDANDRSVDKLLKFRADWVRELGVNPLNAHVVRVKGDSMTPTLHEGDVVLVDASDREPVGGGLYVMMKGDEAVVKRLDRDFDGSLLIISDNRAAYEPRRLERNDANQIRIIGRVRWYGRTLR
jgi:SOS-response transcriptional repressor LexA